MLLKVHRSRDMGDVVAVCDRELLNTTLTHGKLSITVNETFYGTTPAGEDEVRAALKNAGNINIIGRRSVAIAMDMGLVSQNGCLMIGDVPHAQIYRL